MRLIKVLAWSWAVIIGGSGVLVSMFGGAHGGPSPIGGLLFVAVGAAPLGLLFWLGQQRPAGWAEVPVRMLAQAGVAAGSGYEHGAGIAAKRQARTVTLLPAGSWKT